MKNSLNHEESTSFERCIKKINAAAKKDTFMFGFMNIWIHHKLKN